MSSTFVNGKRSDALNAVLADTRHFDRTTPLIERFGYGCDVVKGVIGPKYTCPDTHVFEFGYNHQVLEVRNMNTSNFDL